MKVIDKWARETTVRVRNKFLIQFFTYVKSATVVFEFFLNEILARGKNRPKMKLRELNFFGSLSF